MISEMRFTCLSVSIVSHRHGELVLSALIALSESLQDVQFPVHVWLTLNLPEPDLIVLLEKHVWSFKLTTIFNAKPMGFGANHNQAFEKMRANDSSEWFVVMNPDVFWMANSGIEWSRFIDHDWPSDVGLLCPHQIGPDGGAQDYARQLLTPWGLLARVMRKAVGLKPTGVAESVEEADWVNGACMVWRSAAYAELGGFDERYFMYCEDVDVCLRLRLTNWRIQDAGMTVLHDARRQTGRSARHLIWHLASMLRLWSTYSFWRFSFRKLFGSPVKLEE